MFFFCFFLLVVSVGVCYGLLCGTGAGVFNFFLIFDFFIRVFRDCGKSVCIGCSVPYVVLRERESE